MTALKNPLHRHRRATFTAGALIACLVVPAFVGCAKEPGFIGKWTRYNQKGYKLDLTFEKKSRRFGLSTGPDSAGFYGTYELRDEKPGNDGYITLVDSGCGFAVPGTYRYIRSGDTLRMIEGDDRFCIRRNFVPGTYTPLRR